MSITEWVLNTYNTQDKGLEAAKNFTFIWSLFENQSREKIFDSNMRISEFKLWVDKLKIKRNAVGLVIEDIENHNYISGELIDNIDKAFNHFYQKYNKKKYDFETK